MADAADDAAPPAPKKSGGAVGALINGIGIFVLSLSAVVAGGFVNAKLHPPADMQLDKDGKIKVIGTSSSAGHGEEGAATTAIFYAIDPPLVINFEDGSAVRFLQISMSIEAHDQKAIDSVTKNVPLIRNNLLLLMSNRDYKSMMSREGKESLRTEALAEIRAVQKKTGGPDVDDLLFTTFVVQ
jgi:flagellar FliL protein